MLFAFFVSIIGFAIGIRIVKRLIHENLFEKSEMTKIGTAYVSLMLLLLIFLPRTYLTLWISIFAPLIALSLTLWLLMKRRSTKFRSTMSASLALIALKMKGGRSFRQAFSEITSESEPKMRAKLSEIGSVVVFSQQRSEVIRDSFIAEVIDELILVDRQPHAALKRLAIFREKLRLEDDFRRRSGQVLARIRAQSYVMTGLYIALAAFMSWRFGFIHHLRIFIVSAALFTCGAVWMVKGGRRLKWKV